MIRQFLTGKLWKIATGGAALIALGLTILLMTTYIENKDLTKQRNELARQINDPKTGYIAQLAQSRTNVETLKEEVRYQNQELDRLSKESRERLAATERRLRAAQQETRQMEKQLAGFLATGPQGTTLEDRIRDIDERALQEFVQ